MAEESYKSQKSNKNTKTAKREKFIAFAERRTVNAIKAIRVIGKLGNKAAYEYTDADVSKIVKALTEEIEQLKTRMKSSGRPDSVEFKL